MSERPETGDQHDGGTAEPRGEQSPSESVTAEQPPAPESGTAEQPTSPSVTAEEPPPGAHAESQSEGEPATGSAEAEPATSESARSTATAEPTATKEPTEPTGPAEPTQPATPEQPSAAPADQRPHHAEGFGTPATATAGAGTSAARLPTGITTGLLVAAVGALVTLLAAFLTWASVEVTSRVGNLEGGGTRSLLGVQGGRLGKETLVLAIGALALAVVMRAPSSRAWGWIALLVAGLLVLLLATLDLVAISDASDLRKSLAAVPGCSQAVQCTGNRTVGVGVYLTMLGGLAIAVGALLHHGLVDRLLKRRSTKADEPSRTSAV